MKTALPVLAFFLIHAAAAATEKPAANELSLPPAKDVRITFYPAESEFNGGASPRLRTSNIKLNAGEAIIMDFDRAAIAAFLDKNKDKRVAAKLAQTCRNPTENPGVRPSTVIFSRFLTPKRYT